jgi:transcriptional regulator with XRE-family HTH domain
MPAKRDPDRSALSLFAEEMRAARDRAGLTQDELAARVNYSTTLVAMVESLKRVPQADLAARLDDVLGTPGTFGRLQERLRALPFPASFRPFAAYEDLAVALRNFENCLVPGLLQTEDYARAILSARPNTSEDEVDELVAVRLARQAILDRDEPPALWVVVDEGVLTREIGSPKTMADQLQHLADMAARPNITIQVIPFSAGAHIGLQGAFIIAEFADTPPVAFLATATDGQTIEDASAVARALFTFDNLRSEALPRKASREQIQRLAEERWTLPRPLGVSPATAAAAVTTASKPPARSAQSPYGTPRTRAARGWPSSQPPGALSPAALKARRSIWPIMRRRVRKSRAPLRIEWPTRPRFGASTKLPRYAAKQVLRRAGRMEGPSINPLSWPNWRVGCQKALGDTLTCRRANKASAVSRLPFNGEVRPRLMLSALAKGTYHEPKPAGQLDQLRLQLTGEDTARLIHKAHRASAPCS